MEGMLLRLSHDVFIDKNSQERSKAICIVSGGDLLSVWAAKDVKLNMSLNFSQKIVQIRTSSAAVTNTKVNCDLQNRGAFSPPGSSLGLWVLTGLAALTLRHIKVISGLLLFTTATQ